MNVLAAMTLAAVSSLALRDSAAVTAKAAAQSHLAVALPSGAVAHRAIGIEADMPIFATLESAKRGSYTIAFSKIRGCFDATPCTYGSFSADRVGTLFEFGSGTKVSLAPGVSGYYRPPPRGVVSDGILVWKVGDVFYLLALHEAKAPALVAIARSILAQR